VNVPPRPARNLRALRVHLLGPSDVPCAPRDVAAGINFAVESLFHTLYPRVARAFERHYGVPRDQLFFFNDHVARRALAFRQRAIEAASTPTRGAPKRHNLHISQVLALTRH
jgi:hypothetical protein